MSLLGRQAGQATLSLVLMLLASCHGARRMTPSDAGATIDGGADAGTDSSPWALVTPLEDPTLLEGQALWDVGVAGSDLYVVGTGGVILRSSDQGDSWSSVGLPSTDDVARYPTFQSFSATADDDVWIGGGADALRGVLLHGTDRGQSWQPVGTWDGKWLQSVWAIDRDRVVVATTGGEIWRTTDAGASWTTVLVDPELVAYSFWGAGTSAADLYLVGGRRETADGGASATTLTGVVLRSVDAGATWTWVLRDAPCELFSVSGTPDGATVYAAGNCATIAWTTDHGAIWSTSGAASLGHRVQIKGVWVSSSGEPLFALDLDVCVSIMEFGGSILKHCEPLPRRQHGGGVTTFASPLGFWGARDDDVWAHGASGFLWRRRAPR